MLSTTARPHQWFAIEGGPNEFEHLQGELATIDGEIVDPELDTLRRAELLAARKRLYETLHPSSRHGGAPGRAGGGKMPRRQEGTQPICSHAADAASRTGLSARTVRQLVQIAEDIPQALRDIIRDTPLAGCQRRLLDVARAHRDPEEQQRRVGDALPPPADARAEA